MNRAEILEAARVCVCGEREHDYGTPEDSFALIAKLWTAYTGTKFNSKDVAIMMALLKVARIRASNKEDSFVDLAGYAASAGEIAARFEDGPACEGYDQNCPVPCPGHGVGDCPAGKGGS